MKLIFLLLSVTIAMPVAASAACTIDQRIGLSKAGYSKQEIDALCSAPERPGSSPSTSPGSSPSQYRGMERLPKGSIAGSGVTQYEQRRCRFQEDGVLYRRTGLVPYGRLRYSATAKVDEEDRELLFVVQLDSGFNTESCIVMRVDKFKYRDDARGFQSDLARYRDEYKALLAELAARSIPEDR